MCPELLQEEAHPEALVDQLLPLLEDGVPRRQMLEGFELIRTILGDRQCAAAVTQQVLEAYSAG